MKLKQFLLFTLCITFFACSSESTDTPDEENDDDNVLLKKSIETDADGITETTTYTYDGNKLISVDYEDGWKNIYTYEDDLLVREDQYTDNELTAYLILEYNTDNKIANFKEFFLEPSGLEGIAYKNVFIFNDDNTLTIENYSGDFNSQNASSSIDTFTYNGKNIITIENNSSSQNLYNASYDDKNGMFKNVHAIEVLNIITELSEFSASIYGNTNNPTSIEGIYSQETLDSYEYTYNDNDYPETAIYKDFYLGNLQYTGTIEYFYE